MSASKEWFENWFDSPFYPLLYHNRDLSEASLFVQHLMEYLHPPKGSRMLDIACGEGRFAQQLAGYGHDVTGIDLSVNRIAVARRSEHPHLRFYRHDMRFPFYTNYFDYAFNFFTSFGYFATFHDNQLAARSFAAALRPGGLLTIDYLNSSRVIRLLRPEETVSRGRVRFHIRKYVQQQKIIKEIHVTDTQTGAEHFFREQVSAFGPGDFLSLFGAVGMEAEHIFGNYHLQPFAEAIAPRLILIFRKKA